MKVKINYEEIPELTAYPTNLSEWVGRFFRQAGYIYYCLNEFTTYSVPEDVMEKFVSSYVVVEEDKTEEEGVEKEKEEKRREMDLIELMKIVILSDRTENLIRLRDKGLL